jgi:hypothetical protein
LGKNTISDKVVTVYKSGKMVEAIWNIGKGILPWWPGAGIKKRE